MASQIDEVVLDNFRVGEDDFRDVDSIVRRHCKVVKYYVYKGSALGGYDTDDVEDLLKERNGVETRITSVGLHAIGSDALKFNVEFDSNVVMNGQCEDRARLVLLTTETRAVIQDRMKVKRPNRKTMLQAAAAIFFILGYFGFQEFQNSYVNRQSAEQLIQENRLTAPYQRELRAATPSNQMLLSQAITALSRHNLNAEVDVLLQQQIAQLRQQVIGSKESQVTATVYSTPPWWSSSYWLVITVASAAAVLAAGVGYLIIPSSKSVFLIGDEKRRQERVSSRREHIIWGIGVALVIGIAASLISSLL